jgi:hypothetical protein
MGERVSTRHFSDAIPRRTRRRAVHRPVLTCAGWWRRQVRSGAPISEQNLVVGMPASTRITNGAGGGVRLAEARDVIGGRSTLRP